MEDAGWSLLAAVTVLVLLAGCLGGPNPGEELNERDQNQTTDPSDAKINETRETDEDPGVPEELRLTGCTEHLALVPAPGPLAGNIVPEGWSPQTLTPLGVTSVAAVLTHDCETAHGPGFEEQSVTTLIPALLVEPPEEYQDNDVTDYAIHLGGITTSEDVQATYADWQIDLEVGDVMLDTVQAPEDAARVGQASGQASYSVDVTTALAGPVGENNGGTARLFEVGGGDVNGVADLTWSQGANYQEGTANVLVDAAQPFASQGLAAHTWGPEYQVTIEQPVLDDADPAANQTIPVTPWTQPARS